MYYVDETGETVPASDDEDDKVRAVRKWKPGGGIGRLGLSASRV